MQGLQTQCLYGLTRVLNDKFKTLVFHRCTLLFEKKAGRFCFLAERLLRQLNNAILYRRNEWNGLESELEDLTSEELLEYKSQIHDLIQKAQLLCEEKHGLAIYLDEALSRKLPERKGLEVYNDFNGNLTNLFYCVKNRTFAFLKELGFLPLNSRFEFNVLRRFFEKDEFDNEYLKEEMVMAQQNFPPSEFEEIKAILLEQAEPSDVWRAAAFFKLIRYSYGGGK